MRPSLYFALLGIASSAVAQSTTQLALQTFPGLAITGTVGTVYAIEYTADLTETNNWRCLTFLQLPATNFLWVDTSTPTTSHRFYRSVVFAAPTNLVFIPPGTFRMGSPSNEVDRAENEGPQMSVTISRGFWMGRYLVTQGDYLGLIGTNPSHSLGDTNRPVDNVSWQDATNYCARLTALSLTNRSIPTTCVYRLPTEAEWEYACRAWTSDRRFYYGDDLDYTNLTNYAWYMANSGGTTHPVGQLQPNPWGLYDMAGNVSQHCQDWFSITAPYPGGIMIDPQGPSTGFAHVVRGGSCYSLPGSCRSATRMEGLTPAGNSSFGLRVVLAVAQP